MRHRHPVIVLLLVFAVHDATAQVVEEFRHPGCRRVSDHPGLRTSAQGVTVCIRSTLDDKNTLVFYKTPIGSDTVTVANRRISQAVLVDSLLYVAIYSGGNDTAFASIDVKSRAWKYYPNGNNGVRTGSKMTCFGGHIVGQETHRGPSWITPGASVSRPLSTLWITGASDRNEEMIGLDDGEVILVSSVGCQKATGILARHKRADGGDDKGFPGNFLFNATEIGDSVYWAADFGTCALSVATGNYWYQNNWKVRIGMDGYSYGIAGKNGSLYLDSSLRSPTMTYRFKSSDSTEHVIFPESSDTTVSISGGGWWDGKFYVALTKGQCDETVVYSIAEPDMPTSVGKDNAASNSTEHAGTPIMLRISEFSGWLQRLDAQPVVYDVHGRQVDHHAIAEGTYCVLTGASSILVVVVE